MGLQPSLYINPVTVTRFTRFHDTCRKTIELELDCPVCRETETLYKKLLAANRIVNESG
jgi:hypothetical protein